MYSKKLSTLTLICCLAISPVFAQDEFNEEKFLKQIKKEKIENLNKESLGKLSGFLYKKLFEERNGNEALEISNIEVEGSKYLYGENSLELGYAYTNLITTSIFTQSPLKTLELIKKAEEISQKHPTDTSLHRNTQSNYETFYSHFNQPTKSLEYVVAKSDEYDRKIHQLRYTAEQENEKETLKLLKKLEKEALETNNDSLLATVYSYYLSLYLSIDDYPKMFEIIKKAENIPSLKETVIRTKSSYYKDLSQFDKARELMQELNKGKTYTEAIDNIGALFYIENESKNLEKALSYINYLNNYFEKRYPKDSSLFAKYTYEQLIDINKSIDNDKEVRKYLEKFRLLVEESKDVTPIYYAQYLYKLGNYELYKQNFEKAIKIQKTAIALYEKHEPAAHKLAELYKDIAEAEINNGNVENAFNYIKKAEEHNLKYHGETEKDLKDIYSIYARIYARVGDTSNEEKYLDKAISTYSELLGRNNVKTLQEELEKYYFYNKTQQNNKANAILNKVNKIVAENKHIGYSPDFSFKLATINAYSSIDKGDYEQALKDIDVIKDIKFYRNFEKQQINEIKYLAYKNTGKKLKAYKYKKIADMYN